MKRFIKKIFGDEKDNSSHFCGMTDVGLRRENNEDCFAVLNDRDIYIVADGMGGHNAGEVASTEAVKALDSYFTDELVELMRNDKARIKEHMQSAFLEVNKKISIMSKENPDYAGMGCALITAFVHDNILHTCHVGDVRCYICNQSGISQLTNDHSQVGELVQAGKMTAEEARRSSFKNILTQAIGASTTITPEYHSYTLKDKDRVLLCSDGLWDMLSDEELRGIVSKKQKANGICKELIAQANSAGGKDNITVVVLENRQ
ncbi:MAG: Stp1/IreP family PP2C-type Ser/Thr phosphatase [Thermodesulfobacteriota bacterium]